MTTDPSRPLAGSNDDVAIRNVAVTLDPSPPGTVVVSHVDVVVPIAAFRRLVTTAASRAGVNATGSLGHDQIGVAVSVSLLRLTVTFSPSISDGLLVLQPRGGVPGWLIGRAAPLIGRTAGLSMSGDSRVTVDPDAFLPPQVRLRTGFRAFQVLPDRIEMTLG